MHFAFHETAHIGHRQHVGEVLYNRVRGEAVQVGKRHPLAQFRHADVGDAAVLHVLLVGEHIFREELVAGNLDVEGLFQAEDDVQEVDRLGSQVAHQRGFRLDVFVIHAQGVGEGDFDLSVNFVLCRHFALSPQSK